MATSEFRWTNKAAVSAVNYDAVKKVCLFIEGDAKRLAPVDTGNLRNSLRTDMKTGPADMRQEGTVGTNVEYAVFQEYGARNMQGTPFLGPALEQARRRFG